VLKQCDLAIDRAIASRDKLRADTGLPFDMAVRKLRQYASKFHLNLTGKNIDQVMSIAKDLDQKNMDKDKINMNKPIQVSSQHTELERSPTTVEFRILESLPDKDPVIVHQALFSVDEPEILWNFMHPEVGGSITLSQNPHFYKPLPVSPNAYTGTFNCQPNFMGPGHICVLKNNERRVFLQCGPACCKETRTFDNVWVIVSTKVRVDVQ